jgi:hypothetical protein
MSKRYGVVGCRPPPEASLSYEDDMLLYLAICEAVVEFVGTLPTSSVVVSGGARGVDSVAVAAARARGLEVKEHLPDYATHGAKMAPIVRNILIVDDCDELIAFPSPWSTGTWHAVGVARDKEKNVCVKKIQ